MTKKSFKWSALLTMIISLLISLVSGYCTVVGMGKVFASAATITMGIATVIEIGRVILLYDLHHFWDKLKLFQKIPGILMLLIAMTLSAMGVYGFFANAHSQRTQQVIPIELEIKQKQQEITILNDAIKVNNEQLKQFDGKAFDKYTEMGYVTKAVNLQKEQQVVTNKLYDDNRKIQQEITKLNQEILKLELDVEQKAPTLAHIKYYAKLFNVDDETAIIIFIVMIMLVFDTLAMYLMITSDWIFKLEEDEVKEIANNETLTATISDDFTTKTYELDEKSLDKIKEYLEMYQSQPIIKEQPQSSINEETVEKLFGLLMTSQEQMKEQLIEKFSKEKQEIDLTPLIDRVENIKQSLDNKELIKRLTEIENRLDSNTNNIDMKTESDVLLDKVVDSIDDNENVILTNDFLTLMKKHPNLKMKLTELYKEIPSVLSKLNKL